MRSFFGNYWKNFCNRKVYESFKIDEDGILVKTEWIKSLLDNAVMQTSKLDVAEVSTKQNIYVTFRNT